MGIWQGAPPRCRSQCGHPPHANRHGLPCQPNPLQDSAVGFLLQLDNGAKVQAHVFLCYADAQPCSHAAAAASSSGGGNEEERFAW